MIFALLTLTIRTRFLLFHYVSSLSAHFDELSAIFSLLNFDFSIIGLTETRIKQNSRISIPISMEVYSYEHTPTESSCGGALLYIYRTNSTTNPEMIY